MTESKLVSLDAFRRKKQAAESAQDCPGVLVWLHCPQCGTLEYTEIVAPNGRRHKCGTQVQEAEVTVDLRAEFTITRWNLERIDELIAENSRFRLSKLFSKSLDNALLALKQSEETYLQRLQSAAGRKLTPYPGDMAELEKTLHIVEKNRLGLYLSKFRHQPEKRFEPGKRG